MTAPWELLLGDPGVLERLALVRVTAALVIAAFVLSPDFGRFFGDHEDLFVGKRSWIGRRFMGLRAGVLGLCGLSVLGMAAPLGSAALLVAFGMLDRHSSRFTPTIWHNLFHVHVFLALSVVGETVALVAPDRAEPVARGLLTLMALQVGLVYLLAGVAKLRHGGLAWMREARALQLAVMLRGTPTGRALLGTHARRRAIATSSVVFELGAPLMLLVPSLHPWFAASAIAFHLSIHATMRISFWHLWIFFPALFFL